EARERVPRGEGGRHRCDDGPDWAAYVPLARENERRGIRPLVAARCPAARVRRCARITRGRGRHLGAARRAVPGARSYGRRARCVSACLPGARVARRQAAAPRRDVFRRTGRKCRHGAWAPGSRTPCRSRPRPPSAGSAAREMAQRESAVCRCDRWAECLARRSREGARAPRSRRQDGGQGPVVGGAFLLAAAHAARPRSGDETRSGAERLARVREAEAARSDGAGEGRPRGCRSEQPCRAVARHVTAHSQRRGAAACGLGHGKGPRAPCSVRGTPAIAARVAALPNHDDQPRAETAKQIALAILDEVIDLEAAGIRVIQIDEPALREGLPLRRGEWAGYLQWAVDAFRLATAGVRDGTQIHTHMCYSEFNDVLQVIERMDADVISIENARSGSELLRGFEQYKYPNEIGPGVYDIHSPRVPSTAEITGAL